MNSINIHSGDAVKWAKAYKGEKFHALFCDAPYHLTSIVKRFGNEDSAPAKKGVYSRSSKGFMGKTWDGGDVAFQVETWKAFKRVLYDGAFGMCFASSRGWHRLAVAIEDAGFIIHPSMFGWCYGSGFPKATNIAKQLDNTYGKQSKARNFAGKGERKDLHENKQDLSLRSDYGYVYEPQTDLAHAWQGHRYGLQALKPALEPIIVFQKPYKGRPLDNITQTGAGALNIDASRIGVDSIPSNRWTDSAHPFGNGAGNEYETVASQGRWAANFFVDDLTAEKLDEQAGYLVSGGKAGKQYFYDKEYNATVPYAPMNQTGILHSDEGGASRFFFNVSTQLDEADPVYYCAKAGREERDGGLDNFQKRKYAVLNSMGDNPPAGIDDVSERFTTEGRNSHPTVKPIDLCEYLSKILLPPALYAPRRMFVPFAGVASEMIGAMLAGWEEIEGVELTDEYLPIAKARIDYWKAKPKQLAMFERVRNVEQVTIEHEQMRMEFYG